MVDEVVAGERVDEVALAAQVRGGDGHELAVAGRRRDAPGPGQEAVAVGGEERRRDEDHRVVAGARRLDDRRDRRGVADHELVDQLLGGVAACGSVEAALTRADTALTPP